MISKSGGRYWSPGITVNWTGHSGRGDGKSVAGWGASLDFLDDGWTGDDNADQGLVSTEGTLRSRYFVADGDTRSGLAAVIDALVVDAGRLGITFTTHSDRPPRLFYKGDGESADHVPPVGWREALAAQAERLGWATYANA